MQTDIENTSSLKTDIQLLREANPDKIPIVVKKASDSKLPELTRCKYLVPDACTVGQFLYLIRQRISLAPEQSLFFLIDGKTMAPSAATVLQLYDDHKSDEEVLVLVYKEENTFGSNDRSEVLDKPDK